MSKIKLANDLKRLLPGQANSRIRQAILEAYQRATGAPSLNPEYYQSNITNIVQNVITEVVGVVAPDGIIVYGGVEQDGNDLIFDTDWQWRRSGVAYKLIEETTIPIPVASLGFTREDVIVGNMAGEAVRVQGTEVQLPTVAVAPNIPANTIPLLSVTVSDIGITSFQEFALATFVRFDVNSQNLNPVQRQNARTNIQALSKDTNDSRTGNLANVGNINVNGEIAVEKTSGSGTLPIISGKWGGNVVFSFNGSSSFINYPLLRVGNPVSPTARGVSLKGTVSNAEPIFEVSNLPNVKVFQIRGNGGIHHQKSNAFDTSARRDELSLYFPMTVVDMGQINNLVLDPDAKLLVLTGASDLTGIEMEAGRKLKIFNNTGGNLTIHAESTASIAANRFATGAVIPNQGFQEVIKIGTRIRLA